MDLRVAFPIQPVLRRVILPLLAFFLLANAVRQFDAPVVLGGMLVLAGALPLLIWPEVATHAVAFLLYTNLPTNLYQFYGVPLIVAGAFILLLGIPVASHLLHGRERPKADFVFALMICFLAAYILSSLVAKDKAIAMGRVQTYVLEGVLVYWLFLNAVRGFPALRRVIWTLLLAGSVLGSMTLYQAATKSYSQQFAGLAQRELELEWKRDRDARSGQTRLLYTSDRAGGPMGGANRYAQVMICLMPLAFAFYRTARSRRARLCAAAAGLLIVGGTLLTYSRGGFLTLAVLLPIVVKIRWLRPRHVALGFLCAALVVPLVATGLTQRIASIGAVADLFGDRESSEADGATRGRVTEMLAAFHVYMDHPILGVGPAQYSPFYSEQYQQNPEIKFRDIQKTRRAHSLYFEMAAETGTVGLTIFLLIPALLLRELWRVRRRLADRWPEGSDLATGLALTVLAYLGTAAFLHLSYERYYWLLLALAGAMLQALRELEQSQTGQNGQGGQRVVPARPLAGALHRA